MLFVFLAGAIGFFVFDVYRVRQYYDRTNSLLLSLRTPTGIAVHVFCYVAAGVAALAINFDVLESCCQWQWLPPLGENMSGSLVRGFGLGLAGPAGLARTQREQRPEGATFEDLVPGRGLRNDVKGSFKFFLMR